MPRVRLSRIDLGDLNRVIQAIDSDIATLTQKFDQLRSGDLAFTGNIDLGGNRVTNTGSTRKDSDTLTRGELLDRLDEIEEEAALLETAGSEDYFGGGRQKRLLARTSRLKDLVEDTAANIIAALGFPAVVFTQNDGSGNAELATDTTNFVWDDANNRLGLLTSSPTNTLDVGVGGTVRVRDFTVGSVVFAGTSGVLSQDNANFFWDDSTNRLGLGLATPSQRLHVRVGASGGEPAYNADSVAVFQRNAGGGLDDVGITLLSSVGALGTVRFSRLGADSAATIAYDHTFAWLKLSTDPGATAQMLVHNNGTLIQSGAATTPNARLEVRGGGGAGGTVLVHVERTAAVAAVFDIHDDATIVNEGGNADHDFRVEGDTQTHLIFVDASADRVSIGDSTPDNFFTVGTTSQFQVGTDGDLDRIKDVPYSWPAANAAGYLRNDGAGVLSWDASGAGIDHGGLGGLADDDHTQYLLLAGRAGGQTAKGGTAAGDHLNLDPSSASNYTGSIRLNTTATDYGSGSIVGVTLWPNGFTHGGGALVAISGVAFTGTVTLDASEVASTFNFFRCEPILTNAAAVTGFLGFSGYTAAPGYVNAQAVAATTPVTGVIGFTYQPTFSITAGGTWSNTLLTGFRSIPAAIPAGTTITTLRHFHAEAVANSGTLTTHVAYDTDIATGSTCISYRSTNTAAQMRHAGVAVFGQNAAAQIATEIFRVHQPTIGNHVARWESAATNDDPELHMQQGRVTTTDATVTTLMSITLNASKTTLIEARVVGRRTGGAAGTAEDGIGVIVRGAYKMVGGAATALTNGTPTTDFETDDQAAWTATLDTSGATVRVRVTGAANNNVTWHATCFCQEVGS